MQIAGMIFQTRSSL
ncbi:hypothetical protein [Blautia wexlerae]